MKITLKQIGYKLFHCSPGEFPVGEHQNLFWGLGALNVFMQDKPCCLFWHTANTHKK